MGNEANKLDLAKINTELNTQLSNQAVSAALLATTFKGLTPQTMRQAAFEAMMRGFTFNSFLQKDVYALPYGGGYSLVTSIDYARKKGARGGVCGKSAPEFTMDGKKIVSCTVTVKKKIGLYVGDYTATVFFDEYNTGKGNWLTKPRTMIAKVAEMHALRMACPEELSEAYVEEEFDSATEPASRPPQRTGAMDSGLAQKLKLKKTLKQETYDKDGQEPQVVEGEITVEEVESAGC